MSYFENKRGCKVISEFILLLMHYGYINLNVDFKSDEKVHYYTLRTSRVSEKLLNYIKDNINLGREFDVEEYGWELVGDGDSYDQIDLLGCLLDKFEIENTAEETIFRMARNIRK